MRKLLAILCLLILSTTAAAQEEVITPSSLEGKDLEELYLMRNEIFARHGRPFKTSELDTYFGSQDWYKRDRDYDDSRLSEVDRANIATILKKEKEQLKQNYISENGRTRINFNNVINKRQFGEFTGEEIKRLSNNGFIVTPAKYEQLFFVYEQNDYKGVASFVTTDSVLQLYHIFFDFTLRNLEEQKLYPILEKLTGEMLRHSQELYQKANNPAIKEAARRNMAYFAVPYYFLTGEIPEMDAKTLEIVQGEIAKCKAHEGRINSLIFNPDADPNIEHDVDYTQFIPRGHYTRNEKLSNFFMAMMWLGYNSFVANEDINLIQSFIIAKQLHEQEVDGKRLLDLWQTIYEPTVFYVGTADDLNPMDYSNVSREVFGENPSYEDFASKSRILDFTRKSRLEKAKGIIEELYEKKVRIKVSMIGIPSGPQFRFMGQRYIPDSEILQNLSPWPERPVPKGLDIMAVLGSRLAMKILLEEYKEGEKWAEYPMALNKLIEEFGELQPSDWKQNLYYNWIWSLKSIIDLDKKFKYPYFMNTTAWEAKSINTSLASWAELRHDTILYGKQSGAECGDGGYLPPDPPKGFVEPNVEFYGRLNELLVFSRDGLKERGLLTERMGRKFDKFIELVSLLKTVSEKELTGESLTKREYIQIWSIGGLMEMLTVSVMTDDESYRWYEVENTADKNIAVIADVHTAGAEVLEEGVGQGFEIYVIVEIGGRLKLTRGAVFSYYEFMHPASDRLTDEKWQEMLKQGQEPPLPDWTQRYRLDKPREVPRPKYTHRFHC